MIEKLKIAVCDDETRALAIVSSTVSGIFQDMGVEASLECFLGPNELLERMKARPFDLIFLDISMPKMDGIKLAQQIQAMGSAASVVFVSSRTDRMFDAFSAEPFGFVRKGHFMEDMNEVITRFSQKLEHRREENVVCFKDGHGTMSLDVGRIKYIECVRNAQLLHFEDGQPACKIYSRMETLEDEPACKIYSRMETLEDELKKYGFIRIHKGYLANSKFVGRFEPKLLVLTTGEQLPIGRSYQHGAKAEYLSHISQNGVSYIGRGSMGL